MEVQRVDVKKKKEKTKKKNKINIKPFFKD